MSKSKIGSAGGVGDSLGSQVVSSSQLLSWGVVRGHSTIGVGNQGSSWDWEADSGNSKAVAQPWLRLSNTLLLAGAWDGDVKCVYAWGRLKAQAPSSKTVAQPGLSFSLTLPETMHKSRASTWDGKVGCVHTWGRLKAIAPSSKTVAQPGLSLSFSLTLPETMSKSKIGSTGGVGDSLGSQVVS